MPCSHGNRTPREMYEQAIKCRDGIFILFGRTAEEILKALDFWDKANNPLIEVKQEQKPMTREEAVRIANNKWPHGPNVIDVLEALGLLKFDEVKHDAGDVRKLCSFEGGNENYNIRVERWPEGLVLWVSGEIVWKSWKSKTNKPIHKFRDAKGTIYFVHDEYLGEQ